MPVHYENHVKTKPCPICGKQRPLDWFAADGEPCWKCKGLSWQWNPDGEKQTPEDQGIDAIRKRIDADRDYKRGQ